MRRPGSGVPARESKRGTPLDGTGGAPLRESLENLNRCCCGVLVRMNLKASEAVPSYIRDISCPTLKPSLRDTSSPPSRTACTSSSTIFFSVMRIAGPEMEMAATTLPV